jgi:peptidoglycan/xylan/chitin deacetylase (PgdA/CDA1 family)
MFSVKTLAPHSRRTSGIPTIPKLTLGLRRSPTSPIMTRTGALAPLPTVLHRVVRSAAAGVKTVTGWMIFRSGLHRLLLRGRACIVVFHKVNDEYPDDPITSTIREFEDFVEFFARFFDVISLSELLDRLESGADVGSTLTVTFDDGYQNNATIAAPILERHGLRACFFVTTGFIATNHIPWWDRQAGIQTQWMSWDQVRGLRAAGHEVGSHTATHVDLGVVVGEAARREIGDGKAQLEAEIGESSGLFAYPYGGREHLANENKSIPKDLGLRCALSAYGGTVSLGDDPFALKRTSITKWFTSPNMFGFELVTNRLERV